MAESKKNRAIAAELIAKATRDNTFRQQFVADPKAALIAAGAAIAQDVQVRVVESTEKLRYIILPSLQGDGSDLSQAQIAALAGAGNMANLTITNSFEAAEVQTSAVQTAEAATTAAAAAEVVVAAAAAVVAT